MEFIHKSNKNITFAAVISAIILGISMFFLSPATTVKLAGALAAAIITFYNPLWGLYLAVIAVPLLAAMNELLIMFIALVVASYAVNIIVKYKNQFAQTPLNMPILVFILVQVIATLHSPNLMLSLQNFIVYIAGYGMYFLIINLVNTRKTLNTTVKLFVLVAFIMACAGIFQYFVFKPMDVLWADKVTNPELTARAVASFGNPNVFAEYLEFMVPVIVAMTFAAIKPKKKIVYALMAVIMILCLVLTLSRASYLGFAAAIGLFFLIKYARFIPLLLIGGFSSLFVMPKVTLDRIMSIGSLNDTSNAYRVQVWEGALHMIRDFWITGVGFGYWAFKNAFVEYTVRGAKVWHSHNLFLEITAETGVFGILAFLWIVVMLFVSLIKFSKQTKDRTLSFLSIGLLCSLVSLLIHGVAEHILYMPSTILMFWMITALAMAVRRVGLNSAEGQ